MRNSYEIVAGDYERIGAATSALKETLKRIGADPSAIRKAVIAAYEAEANVVIHATRGRMNVEISPERLDVEVVDEGPGISDIGLAMKEGYSTAPPKAREIGFGAGMGLPNIKRNADRFFLESEAGRGTRLRFVVFLGSEKRGVSGAHSIRIFSEKCVGCLGCIRGCPTRALRVYDNRPLIVDALCVDCGACIGACSSGAIGAAGCDEELPTPEHGAVLVATEALTAQFSRRATLARIAEQIRMFGFSDVYFVEEWHRALRDAVEEYARTESPDSTVISPVCPAILNLIACRFHSLLDRVAPFLSPMEAAASELAGRKAVFAFLCPSQETALAAMSPKVGAAEIVSIRSVIRRLAPRMAVFRPSGGAGGADTCAERVGEEIAAACTCGNMGGTARVTGIWHAMAVLTAMENGALHPASVVEIYACDGGCFGAPLLNADPFIASWTARAQAGDGTASRRKAVRRSEPLAAREGLRLDANMAKAIEKLARIDALARSLPGLDCGLCGAPSCYCMAEDVVMGRVASERCARKR